MSTGHPNRRRGGDSRPRHGPQKQDRAERQPGRNTAALVANSAAQADQPRSQPRRERQPERAARPPRADTTSVSSLPAPVVPIARRKGALRVAQQPVEALLTTEAAAGYNHGPIVEADAPEKQGVPAVARVVAHARQHTVVVRAYEAHEAHEAHKTHETHKTHIAHSIHEVYDTHDTLDTHDTRHIQPAHEEAHAHTIIADVSAHIVIEHTHEVGGQEPTTSVEPPVDSTAAPRARMSRFYAPGGLRIRPDESWVEPAAAGLPAEHEQALAPAYLPAPTPLDEYSEVIERPRPRDELDHLIDSLHTLFEHDRSVASQNGAARCGVCYLHFPLAELEYRDGEGFYVCSTCQRALGGAHIPMVRRQQK